MSVVVFQYRPHLDHNLGETGATSRDAMIDSLASAFAGQGSSEAVLVELKLRGVFRILSPGGRDIELFVREWFGALIDYDRQRRSDLVKTLSDYLECGGNYDETAGRLVIHRSTPRYRRQRIREITGLDLGDVDNRLNLLVATRAWQVLNAPDILT